MAGTGMKSLAKDTAIYGLSSIVGRFLNWCLFPLHTYIFTNPVEYGKVSYIYGYIAVVMILLTYGMETGFFRFMNKQDENPSRVYSTSLISLAATSLLFIVLCFLFIDPIASAMKYSDHKDHILMMALVVALDAFMTIPYAYLRYQKRPMRFMYIRMAFVVSNILFNLFFLLICPYIYKHNPSIIDWFYTPDYGIGYIFLANLLSTVIVLLLLLPNTIKGLSFQFDRALLQRILKYSLPLLILGVAGVVSQAVAQITYPFLFDSEKEAFNQLGIYSACLKITVVITMFIQAFRYAYEPFFFGNNKDKNSTKSYADAMKYFVIFALFIFVAIMLYTDLIEYFMSIFGKKYAVGLNILPIAMLGEILFGIYFNLSVWYKLTDKTKYGAWFSVFGCVLQILINIIFVPIYGYIASAWATLISNLIIVGISYFIGQKYFPIKYDIKSILLYFGLALGFYLAAMLPEIDNIILRVTYRTVLLVVFAAIVIKRDMPLGKIPIISKYINKR